MFNVHQGTFWVNSYDMFCKRIWSPADRPGTGGQERTAGVWDYRGSPVWVSGAIGSGVGVYLRGQPNLLGVGDCKHSDWHEILSKIAKVTFFRFLVYNISGNCDWSRVVARQECSPGRYVSGGWILGWGWCVVGGAGLWGVGGDLGGVIQSVRILEPALDTLPTWLSCVK